MTPGAAIPNTQRATATGTCLRYDQINDPGRLRPPHRDARLGGDGRRFGEVRGLLGVGAPRS